MWGAEQGEPGPHGGKVSPELVLCPEQCVGDQDLHAVGLSLSLDLSALGQAVLLGSSWAAETKSQAQLLKLEQRDWKLLLGGEEQKFGKA